MSNKYTINSFKMNKIIAKSQGYWSDDAGRFDVNYSSILTHLIQSAGRWCENYASDLFIDWCEITSCLKDPDFLGGTYLFGFRKNGVDGESYIISNAENGKNLSDYYREILRLEINIENNVCLMVLGEVYI